MRDFINQSTIWEFVGDVSAMSGLVCFALSSTYNMSFGKLGIGGVFVYLLICSIMRCLMLGAKRIRVPEEVQGLVGALIFVVICVISVVHDKLVTGKPDALSIISYGSFALMSVSVSRKLELGFQTGFSAFSLQLFAAQLFKIKWFLLPIALVFCGIIIILRHYYSDQSEVQSGPGSSNAYHRIGIGPPNATDHVIGIPNEDSNVERRDSTSNGEVSGQSLLSRNNQQNTEEQETGSFSPASQDSRGMGEVSGQSLPSTNNLQNNQEESSEAMQHSPRNNGEVSKGSMLDWDNLQNNEESPGSKSFKTENDKGLRRRRRRPRRTMRSGIQNISSDAPKVDKKKSYVPKKKKQTHRRSRSSGDADAQGGRPNEARDKGKVKGNTVK